MIVESPQKLACEELKIPFGFYWFIQLKPTKRSYIPDGSRSSFKYLGQN